MVWYGFTSSITYTIGSGTMKDISKKLRYSISAESPPFLQVLMRSSLLLIHFSIASMLAQFSRLSSEYALRFMHYAHSRMKVYM